MKMKRSSVNQRHEIKSYRQQKSDELYNLAKDLEEDSLGVSDHELLISMLKRSAQNLMEVNDKWMIQEDSKDIVKNCISDSFFALQDALDSISSDPWENEWRCDFSNRVMHKSLPLQSLKKDMIKAQRMVYNVLKNMVDNPFDWLVEFSEGDLSISDMNFHVVDYRGPVKIYPSKD